MQTLTAAQAALDKWDVDDADAGDVAEVFSAIYERQPDDDEDAVSLIYAARDVLTDAEAHRVLAAL